MQQYQRFTFDTFSFNDQTGEVALRYGLDDELQFNERLFLPLPTQLKTQDSRLKTALAALHLIGGISYYKTCLPKTLEVRSQSLTADQAKFWNTIYENGLGEFFYRNQIDFRGLINFPISQPIASETVQSKRGIEKRTNERTKKRVLVPIGGGKDSMVTIELLRAAGHDITLLRMEPHPVIDALAKEAGLPMLTIRRSLDPLLFRLNADGALNGHVPITAYLSFAAIAVALLHDFDAVVMSNERSANIGNIDYLGKTINHQWSKGLECERMMQTYLKQNIDESIEYFSLLRPLSELHITRMFTGFPQYLPLATSCNANWKILKQTTGNSSSISSQSSSSSHSSLSSRWCGHCPKCAFVFAMLAAFVPKKELESVFGANLFDDASLLPLYRELLGIDGFKPFECVGTPEETLAAFVLAHERGEYTESASMKMALEEAILPTDVHAMIAEQFTPSTDHAIPPTFQSILF